MDKTKINNMKDMSHNPDPVRDLLREEGLLTLPEGFTDHIMQRISAEPVLTKRYTPLLSGKTWLLLLGSVLLIVLTCLAVLPGSEGASVILGNIDIPEALRLNGHLNGHLNLNPTVTGSLKLATLILDAIVLLLLLDHTLQKRFGRTLQ
jgi:hypothetical protein